jgi:hypothetical protein
MRPDLKPRRITVLEDVLSLPFLKSLGQVEDGASLRFVEGLNTGTRTARGLSGVHRVILRAAGIQNALPGIDAKPVSDK